MPSLTLSVVMVRTTSAPCWWPRVRSQVRALAQRPLPSMMIATWRGRRCGSRPAARACTWGLLRVMVMACVPVRSADDDLFAPGAGADPAHRHAQVAFDEFDVA